MLLTEMKYHLKTLRYKYDSYADCLIITQTKPEKRAFLCCKQWAVEQGHEQELPGWDLGAFPSITKYFLI